MKIGEYEVGKPDIDVEAVSSLPHGPGRIHKADARDARFRMATIANAVTVAIPELPRFKYFSSQWHGNQKETGTCTAFGALNFFHDGPITHRTEKPYFDPFNLYQQIRRSDGLDPDPTLQEGATTRGIGEYFRELGIISGYHWADQRNATTAVEEIDICVRANVGPVLIGTDWTDDMFTPDARGFIRPTGRMAGGHLWIIGGSNPMEEKFRVECAWKDDGPWYAYIRWADVETLLEGLDYPGEAMIAVEDRKWKP